MLKKLFVVLSSLFVLALVVQPVYADSGSAFTFTLPKEVNVAAAIAGMYAPSPSGGETLWSNSLCSEMSSGGCNYFRANEASMLWQKGQGDVIEGSAANFDGVVSSLEDGSQVWKLTITLFTKSGSPTYTVFAHVVRDNGGRWVLNRILYGPYIKSF